MVDPPACRRFHSWREGRGKAFIFKCGPWGRVGQHGQNASSMGWGRELVLHFFQEEGDRCEGSLEDQCREEVQGQVYLGFKKCSNRAWEGS